MRVAIADDLSGAAEIGGCALLNGFSAEVLLDSWQPSSCDVVIIDTNTRSDGEETVVGKLQTVLGELSEVKCDIYKKVDSVLRGSVALELRTMMECARYSHCLLVNANPRRQRVVLAGKLMVEGRPLDETDFAEDPEHPCRTSDVRQLLGDYESEIVSPGELSRKPCVSIGNAGSSDDLLLHAKTWYSNRAHLLPCGGAEFFEAWLQVSDQYPSKRVRDEKRSVLLADSHFHDGFKKRLIVSGSALAQPTNFPCIPSTILQGEAAKQLEQLTTLLNTHGTLAMRASEWTNHQPEDRLNQFLNTAKFFIHELMLESVWIEGGHTASMLLRRLGCTRLKVTSVLAEGVVELTTNSASFPRFVIKPGSYSWPESSYLST